MDFVLKSGERATVAVEVKSISTELSDKHAGEGGQYAAIEGIEWCLLTNGRELKVYNAGLAGDLAAKHVVDLDLLADDQDQTLDVLCLLSKNGLTNPDALRDWMKRAVLDRALRLMLLD